MSYIRQLADLSLAELRAISARIGNVREVQLARKISANSYRQKIADFVKELREKYGPDIITPKVNIEAGPARDEYIQFYLSLRSEDIGVKHDQAYYEHWAIVHLKDALRYRSVS